MGKGRYGGKYPKIDASGYYGSAEAGTKQNPNPAEAGTGRELGIGSKRFTFYSETHGTLTVWADSFEEAWRQAKTRGYSRRNYMR